MSKQDWIDRAFERQESAAIDLIAAAEALHDASYPNDRKKSLLAAARRYASSMRALARMKP